MLDVPKAGTKWEKAHMSFNDIWIKMASLDPSSWEMNAVIFLWHNQNLFISTHLILYLVAHEFTIELSWWCIEGGLSPVHVVLNQVSSSQSFMISRDKFRPQRKTEVPTTQEQPKLRVSVLTLCRLFHLWVSLSTTWIHILFLGKLLEEYKYYPEVDFSPTYIWLSYIILTTTKTKRILDFYIYIYMPFNTTQKEGIFRGKFLCILSVLISGKPAWSTLGMGKIFGIRKIK